MMLINFVYMTEEKDSHQKPFSLKLFSFDCVAIVYDVKKLYVDKMDAYKPR